MKVINTGKSYSITDDSLKTYDKLPAGVYTVRFSKMRGFYLDKHAPMEVNEEKIYGVHEAKVKKVLNTFDHITRSLGVILSGNKGIGKSMFARLLSIEAVKKGMPLIIVEGYAPGIASFLEEIEQEVVILFDEFDKTFGGKSDDDPQATMLSLFDGITSSKKLFVITCNSVSRLNDYLVNRPGRFHYHLRFEYPTAEEVKEYLMDKLKPAYRNQINAVVNFSRKIDLNYDCLRAIAFELNMGIPFEEAIRDLNILNITYERYDVTMHFENGASITETGRTLELFGSAMNLVPLYGEHGNIIDVRFKGSDAVYDPFERGMVIRPEKLTLTYDEDFDKELVEEAKALIPSRLVLVKQVAKGIHYDI